MPKLETMGCRLRHGIEFTACVSEDFPFEELVRFLSYAFSYFDRKWGPERFYTWDRYRDQAPPGDEDAGSWLEVSHPCVAEGRPVRTYDWLYSLAHSIAVGELVCAEGGGWELFESRMEMARWDDD
jgi:hypothetical protein